jgi:flagellar hook-basal body complex protein FliE
MPVNAISAPVRSTHAMQPAPAAGFDDLLNKAIASVNRQELESQRLGLALAAGEVSDIHTVTIAAQKAELALDLTLAVRNKVLDAYQEIMRMQV